MAIAHNFSHPFSTPIGNFHDSSHFPWRNGITRWSMRTSHVVFEGNSVVTRQKALDNWRNNFCLCWGFLLLILFLRICQLISARFHVVFSACKEDVGLFDAPFSASQLRHALALCVDFASMACLTHSSNPITRGGNTLSSLPQPRF